MAVTLVRAVAGLAETLAASALHFSRLADPSYFGFSHLLNTGVDRSPPNG